MLGVVWMERVKLGSDQEGESELLYKHPCDSFNNYLAEKVILSPALTPLFKEVKVHEITS